MLPFLRSRAHRTGAAALLLAALAACGGGGSAATSGGGAPGGGSSGGGGPAGLAVSSPTVLFSAAPGTNPSPPAQTVQVAGDGGAAVPAPTATVSASGSGWLTAAVTGSAAPYALTLTVSSATLAPGQYQAVVALSAPGVTGAAVNVQLAVEATPGPMTVTGHATYDFVPSTFDVTTGHGGLRFDQTVQKPVRNALVQAVQGTSVLATATTDANGAYQITFTPPSSLALAIQVIARSTSPVIEVRDNTAGGALWGMFAGITPSTTTQDLRATSGWSDAAQAYDPAHRIAAPFAVLDSMYTAATAFQALPTWRSTFPDLKVFWSPNNQPGGNEPTTGLIGTSHYSPSENAIYVLGKAGVDTDEFDSHVIVHEWGHFFESNLSRSDSIGGPHAAGDVLDPRVAFGEGYGNAIAAMLLPETTYADTLWANGALTAFGFDAETAPPPSPTSQGNPADDPNPSAFSETSVMRLLYDLYDGPSAAEPFDGVQIGLGGVYEILIGHQKATPALTTIGSFVTGVKGLAGVDAGAVNALLAHYGIGPIADDFGTGDDGKPDLPSMYAPVPGPLGGAPVTSKVTLDGRFDYNKWQQNQYFVVAGTGRTVNVTSTSAQDVDLYAFHAGGLLAKAEGLTGNESLAFPTVAGEPYVVSLVGFGTTQGPYEVTLSFSSP